MGPPDLSFLPKLRHQSHHQLHTSVLHDYQLHLSSSEAVISSSGLPGAWVAASLNLDAILLRGVRTSAFFSPSLRHSKAISSTNRRIHWTPPSLRASPFSLIGRLAAGAFTRGRRDQFLSDPVLSTCRLYPKQSSQLSVVSVHSISQTLTLIFPIKIGIFAWQFECPVVSA